MKEGGRRGPSSFRFFTTIAGIFKLVRPSPSIPPITLDLMLCLFAQHFPAAAASLLERSKGLRRAFREETVTDVLMANLLIVGGGFVIVDFPDEPTTGADMEWTFVNRDAGTSFQLLLQAKKLHDKHPYWQQHSYRELFYQTGQPKVLQAELLCDTARTRGHGAYPLYIFYNTESACHLANAAGAKRVHGINLCDAHIIRALAKIAGNKRMYRSLGLLHQFFFSLTDILCPSNLSPLGPMMFSRSSIPLLLSFEGGKSVLGRPYPPRPDQVRARLVREKERLQELLVRSTLENELPEIPRVRDSIPEDIQLLLNSFGDVGSTERKKLEYWRVVFVSHNASGEPS